MKRLIALLLILLCVLTCACAKTTYKDVHEIGLTFREHKDAFAQAADALKGLSENAGFIHKPVDGKPESFCTDSDSTLEEVDGLHIHSQGALSVAQKDSVVAAVLPLMQEVKIDSISFSGETIRFILHDENTFSWDPTLVYSLMEEPDESRIGFGEEILHLEERWYACIVDR